MTDIFLADGTMIEIRKLLPEEYNKCNNIWDMNRQADLARTFYDELISGNRVIFVCVCKGEFIGEGALVFEKGDSDYTIQGQRVYFSRLMVKEECRKQKLGSLIVDNLIRYAAELGYGECSIGVDLDNIAALRLYEKKGFTEVIFRGCDEQGEYVKLLKRLKEEEMCPANLAL